MNLETFLVGGVLLLIVAAIIGKGVWKIRHHKGGGCTGCGGSCGSCGGCCRPPESPENPAH